LGSGRPERTIWAASIGLSFWVCSVHWFANRAH
jgi:hypothetical protein